MARFPRTEAETLTLAQAIVSGLAADADMGGINFPAPPVSVVDLTALVGAYNTAKNAAVAAQATAEQATSVKDDALEDLVDAMKSDLRYAEDAVDYDDAKLSALGWGGKAAATALEIPGQPRSLESPRQGEGWIFLDWKKPSDGGAVAAYKIERRERPAGDWILVSMAMESEATLSSQERGKDWEYRIIATNKAGESEPSNTVAAVL